MHARCACTMVIICPGFMSWVYVPGVCKAGRDETSRSCPVSSRVLVTTPTEHTQTFIGEHARAPSRLLLYRLPYLSSGIARGFSRCPETPLLKWRSEAGMARQGKFKRHDCSEANAVAAKTNIKASLTFTTSRTHP